MAVERGEYNAETRPRYQTRTIDKKVTLCQRKNLNTDFYLFLRQSQFPECKPQRPKEVEKKIMGQKGIPEARDSDTSSTRSGNKGGIQGGGRL